MSMQFAEPAARTLVLAVLLLSACSSPAPRPVTQAVAATPGSTEASGASGTAPAAPAVALPALATEAFQAGVVALQRKDWRTAEARFAELSLRYPELPGPWVNLGIAQWRGGKPDAGRATLDKAVQTFPSFAPASAQLALLLREQGDFKAADAAYQRALAVNPDYPEALYNRAVLNDLYLQRPDVALALFERYHSLRPDDASAERHITELRRRSGGAAKEAS